MNQTVESKQLAAWQTTIAALTPYKPTGSTYQRSFVYVDAVTVDKLKGKPKQGTTRRFSWGNIAPPLDGLIAPNSVKENCITTVQLVVYYDLSTDTVLSRDVVAADTKQIKALLTNGDWVTGVNIVRIPDTSFVTETDEVATIGTKTVNKRDTLKALFTISIDTSEAI